ncbi:hypothetical protein [Streptomyces prasinus]|uniref:hypothetical protein n=1 Tax=Streptomyces prasinus TaxID=67345 RepID=UPI00339EFB41
MAGRPRPPRDEDGHRHRFGHHRLGGWTMVRVRTGIGCDTHRDAWTCTRTAAAVWGDDRSATATPRNDRGRTVDAEPGGRR